MELEQTAEPNAQGIIALLPFLVSGALSLSVLREMLDRGLDITVACDTRKAQGYTVDLVQDLSDRRRLVDLSLLSDKLYLERLDEEIVGRSIGLVLQIGATRAYEILPYLKAKHPRLKIVDTLYNQVGHTVNHFLYENCFDGVVVESAFMKSYIEKCSSKSNPNVALVKSGVNLKRFTSEPYKSIASRLVLGYIGRMSPEKNPVGFVDLAERLGREHPQMTFLMFGEGMLTDEIRRRVDASSLGERIRFEGYVPDLLVALRAIHVLVVPSHLDGRPNIIMEANASARPVLAAPVGGIPELVEDGQNGFLVNPIEHEKISSILRIWESDETLFAAISQSARAMAVANFDSRRMMGDYEKTFRGILSKDS